MTYIKIDDNLDLITTVAEPIYQGDNFSKAVTFLVPEIVGELNPLHSLAYLIYIRADGHPDIVYLEREEEKYNEDYYQYIVPIPEFVTRYPGEIVLWLEFYSGKASDPKVLKTGTNVMHVTEHISVSENKLGDNHLTALYQLSAQLAEAFGDVTLTDNEVILF